MARNEEWTRGEFRTDNNHAEYFEIRFHQTCLARVRYVSFDDNKKSMVAPNWEPRGAGRFYFYEADSISYALQKWHTASVQEDHSTTLSIRGNGDASKQVRSRWGHHLEIPVVSKAELDEFLGHRNDREHVDPSRDEDEQYEPFLRNLLEFDDWRRQRGNYLNATIQDGESCGHSVRYVWPMSSIARAIMLPTISAASTRCASVTWA